MRLLSKTQKVIKYYKRVTGADPDGTEYEDYETQASFFVGNVFQTAGGIKTELYGERITDMISIATKDSDYPNKHDKVVYKDKSYKVIAIMNYDHSVLDCEAI